MKNTSIKIHPISGDENRPMKKAVGQLSVDILQTKDEIIILAPIAGVQEKDVTLTITEDVLVIKGTRTEKFKTGEENYYTRECFWGDFSRSIVLPEEADTKKVAATFENHVLEIHIPKTEKVGTQVIKIKTS